MISIVVCTHDRAAKLQRMLHSLEAMVAPSTLEWEVLIVDNSSHDATRSVVADMVGAAAVPARYVLEESAGLSWARNAGLRAARGDIVAFTDDDCLVDRHWLARVDDEFRDDPALGIVGGRVELHDSRDRPVSVRPHRERVRVTTLAEIARFMIGCNLSCRRRLFAEIGDFDVRFGSGASIPAAEDWDFVYRSLKAGTKIVFSPDVLLFHDHGRRSDAQVESARRRYAIGRWAFYCKHAMAFDVGALRMAIHDLAWLLRDLARWRREPRHLVPVVLGIAYWLRALAGARSTSPGRRW